jgi:hypothetical protein
VLGMIQLLSRIGTLDRGAGETSRWTSTRSVRPQPLPWTNSLRRRSTARRMPLLADKRVIDTRARECPEAAGNRGTQIHGAKRREGSKPNLYFASGEHRGQKRPCVRSEPHHPNLTFESGRHVLKMFAGMDVDCIRNFVDQNLPVDISGRTGPRRAHHARYHGIQCLV